MSHLFVVQLDIPAEHEAEFNRVYDTEHFPSLMKVPGVLNGARYRLEHSTVPGMQRYLTIYEIESPAVLASQAWEKALSGLRRGRVAFEARDQARIDLQPEARGRIADRLPAHIGI